MNLRSWVVILPLGVAALCLVLGAEVSADEPVEANQEEAKKDNDGDTVSREEHEELLREVERLRSDMDRFEASQGGGEVVAGAGDPTVDGNEEGSYTGGVFDKPFLEDSGAPRVHVGGYFDVEFRDAENQNHEFRFHRFIPFFYADIHERIRFASELEIEDGEDVSIEFAFLEFSIIRPINVRGGVVLTPLGKFNLIHDSPINDLTDRPLVNRFVIPTTMREVGAGFYGSLLPEDSTHKVDYEVYVTSGFKGLADNGMVAFSTSSGVRSGRASGDALDTSNYDDINNGFAGTGRLSYSPALGSEFGVSAHSGDYDESGQNNLTITALDGFLTIPEQRLCDALTIGKIELQGEFAYAFIERDALAGASGIPGDLWGYYGQANYHFMPDCLTKNLPAVFLPQSTFTFVTRWDFINLDGDRRKRLTVGLNYRPVETVAVKFDYQFNNGTGLAASSADDDAFVMSLTSYF